MKNFNILITGGFGLLGQAVINLLNKKNFNLIILDKNKSILKKINISKKKNRIIIGNFLDKKKLKNIFKKYKIKVVFHLGATTQVNEALSFPASSFENNINGTINILEIIRKFNKKILFIFASSDKAYGECKTQYKENSNMKAIFPYDLSKMSSDLICQSYAKIYNLKVGILRCGNLFGRADFNMNRIIPDIMRSIIKNKPIILRSNGKMRRDYLHVDDAANAYFLLMKFMMKNKKNLKIYNVGSKTNLTVIELVKKVLIYSKKKNYRIIIKNRAKNELNFQKLNFSKIKKELKWSQNINFIHGLKDTISWYFKNENIIKKL
jgi:CDP-glucose 4,6-dehydratase